MSHFTDLHKESISDDNNHENGTVEGEKVAPLSDSFIPHKKYGHKTSCNILPGRNSIPDTVKVVTVGENSGKNIDIDPSITSRLSIDHTGY